MRRPGRVFVEILLLSVVMNLADWPYLDEIFGSVPTGAISEIFGAQPVDRDVPATGAASKARHGR